MLAAFLLIGGSLGDRYGLLCARRPEDAEQGRKIRKLASSRHAPGDWITRARIISCNWEGLRNATIAEALGSHPKTVRERIHRFNTEGIIGLGDRPRAGRKPRLKELERSKIIALVAKNPPGKLVTEPEGVLSVPRRRDQGSLLDSGRLSRGCSGDGYRDRAQPGKVYPAT